MNEEVFNLELRKFLKTFGVTTQREVEKAVRAAIASGQLKGHEVLRAHATMTIDGVATNAVVDGEIALA